MAKRILIVDDNNVTHRIVKQALSDVATVLHARDGESGIEQAKRHQPDIILLDVEMPKMNGYQVCELLKADPQTADISVLFLSAKQDIAERMRGYQAGGDDYITKPFNAEEVKARIKVLYQYKQNSQRLEREVFQAHSAASIAMSDSGDLGRVVRFMNSALKAEDFDTLAAHLLAFFDAFALHVVFVFRAHNQDYYYGSDAIQCPLERDLLAQNQEQGRFVDFDTTTQINFPNVSVLVKNMPVDDSNLFGRYKDLFPHTLEAVNSLITQIDMRVQSKRLSKKINQEIIGLAPQFAHSDQACEANMLQLADMTEQLENLLQQNVQPSEAESDSNLDVELF